SIMPSSKINTTDTIHPNARTKRGQIEIYRYSQASVPLKILIEIANFVGFSQAGTPVMMRSSRKIPAADAMNAANIKNDVAVNGELEDQAFPISVSIPNRVITHDPNVDYVNIFNHKC